MTLLLVFAVVLLIAVLLSAMAHRTVLSTAVLFLAADVRGYREVKLAGPPPLTPLPQEFAHRVHDHAAYSSSSWTP